MPFAAALSEHPLATHATGECVGQLLEALGPEPDVVVAFVTAAHAGALEDIGATVRRVLAPRALVGATAVSVLGGPREAEEVPAVALWGGRTPGGPRAVRLEAVRTADGDAIVGLPPEALDGPGTLVLLADPFSFPVEALTDHLAGANPGLTVVGGLASAARGPGGNRLLADAAVAADGAVGVLFGAEQPVTTAVSQGCRPVGDPFVVTRAEANRVEELAGRPALERLRELLAGLGPEELQLAQQGLHVGRVIDERKPTFDRGDFLIRGVLGAHRETGAVVVGDRVEVGSTVQFQVRDAASADEDLRWHLDQRLPTGPAASALVFTCNGRGSHLFGPVDHDARLVSEALEGAPVAGMFCAGEIGPVGGRAFLHGFTASIALFHDR